MENENEVAIIVDGQQPTNIHSIPQWDRPDSQMSDYLRGSPCLTEHLHQEGHLAFVAAASHGEGCNGVKYA